MGWGGAMAMALLAAIPLMAGCTGPPPPPAEAPRSPFLVEASELRPDRFYAFEHGGGTLAFGIGAGSDTRIDLFDRDDRRVGEYGLGRARAASDLRFESLPAGSYVVRVVALNGTVDVESGGRPVLLWPLQGHVERVILAQRPHDPVPGVPFVPREVLEVPIHLNLTRTPTGLRLLSDGGFGDLHLTLEGARGEVFRSDWGSGKFPTPFWSGMSEVPGTFRPERASDGQLHGKLTAHDLKGSLILEATSYSRAIPPGQERVGTQPGPGRYTYGLLPPVPVSFQVAQGTTRLALWTMSAAKEGSAPAWVALFDPADRKLASVPVFPGVVSTVAVDGGGTYVAALLSGNVTLGADVAPADFGMQPLQTIVQDRPARPAGESGDYGQANESAMAEGVLFDAQPAHLEDPVGFLTPFAMCPSDASVRIVQDGETLAAWGPEWSGWQIPVGALLHGDASIWHDGFGATGCMRNGVRLLSYER